MAASDGRQGPADLRRRGLALMLPLLVAVPGMAGARPRRGAAGGGEVQDAIAGRPVVISPAAGGARAAGHGAPVVMGLHGGGPNGARMARQLPLAGAGVTAVYPFGTAAFANDDSKLAWNAGTCCGYPVARGVDDVAYLSAVVEELRARGLLGPQGRVDLVGGSNGGMMALRFATERPDLVRAVVGLSAAVLGPLGHAPGLPVHLFHGDSDTTIPIGGGPGRAGFVFPSLAQSVALLRAAGAQVETTVLRGAGHGTNAINAALRRQRGVTLVETIRAIFARVA